MLGKASCEEGMSLKGVLGGVYDVEILLVFGWTLGFHPLDHPHIQSPVVAGFEDMKVSTLINPMTRS